MICLTFIQRRPNVVDVGPTLYECCTNVLYLLGSSMYVPGPSAALRVALRNHAESSCPNEK